MKQKQITFFLAGLVAGVISFLCNAQHLTIKCLLLAVLLCATPHAQAKGQDPFSPVPASLRPRLIERLRLLVEYQRTQQWENQYNLLSVVVTQGESKEDHVKRLQRLYAEGLGDPLIDFTPKSVTYRGGGPADVVIFGCAMLWKKNGTIRELSASVEAFREKEDWYFSPVGLIMSLGGKPEPCPYSNAAAKSSGMHSIGPDCEAHLLNS